MTVKELIEKLKTLPQDYEVMFESDEDYGSVYLGYIFDINVIDKYRQVVLKE